MFYDDAPLYGGHQITAVVAAEHLARSHEVVFAFSQENGRLRKRLNATSLRLAPIHCRWTRAQPLLAPFGIFAGPATALLQEWRPDQVVAVQGSILQSNRIVEAARRVSVPVVSFIPMPLRFRRTDWLRRSLAVPLARYHYRRPGRFITTSKSARHALMEQGAQGLIDVAYFGPVLGAMAEVPRDAARSMFGFSGRDFVLAIVGRVSFNQKGHDVLLRALPAIRSRYNDVRLLVAGDGEDDQRFNSLVEELGLSPLVTRAGWSDRMAAVYAAADLVLIPSRFEGLPLVALEAMYYRKPIVASDIDGLHEILPRGFLVTPDDAAALVEGVARVRETPLTNLLEELRGRIERQFNSESFGRAFERALNCAGN